MQQHGSKYFSRRPPDPRGQKVKIKLFQNMVMLHIKLDKIMKCSNMVAHNPHSNIHSDPRGQKVKIQLFQNIFMLHINLKGIKYIHPP